MTSERRTAFKNLGVLVFSAPIGSLANMILMLVLARYLLSEGFGLYSAIISIINLFAVFIMGGRSLVVRNIAREPERLREIFATTKGLVWILSLASFGGILLVMKLTEELASLSPTTYILAGLTATTLYHALGHGIAFIATERMEINAIGSVSHKILLLILGLIVIWLQLSLDWVLATGVAGNLLLWGFYRWEFQRSYGKVSPAFNPEKLWDLFKQIAEVGSITIVRRISWNVDVLLLTLLVGSSVTGGFNIVYNIIFSLNMFPIFVGLAFFPMMSRMGVNSRTKLLGRVRRYTLIFFVFSVPLVFLLSGSIDQLLLPLLGMDYARFVPVMRLLTFDILLSIPISMFLYVFLALNMQKVFLLAVSLSLVTNVILDLLLIPVYGGLGAAIGTLAGDSVCFAVLLFGQSQRFLPPLEELMNPDTRVNAEH